MDSANNISRMPDYSTTTTTSTSSFFSPSTWTWKMWTIIIIILAMLGINIFIYLAKGTQIFSNFIGKFLGLFGNLAINTTKTAVKAVDVGATTGINLASGTVIAGLSELQQLPGQIRSNVQGTSLTEQTGQNNTTLHTALNTGSGSGSGSDSSYQADDSSSSIQQSKGSGKAGWCYIGEEKGYGSCIHVSQSDQCMSGEIFPSQEICVNPNLRQ